MPHFSAPTMTKVGSNRRDPAILRAMPAPLAPLVAACLLSASAAACGGDDKQPAAQGTETAVVQAERLGPRQPSATGPRRAAGPAGAGRPVREPALRHRAAARPAAGVRGRAGRADPGGPGRADAAPAVPRRVGRHRLRRRAGPARPRLRARLRAHAALLRQLHRTAPATRGSSSTAPGEATATSPTGAARGSSCARTSRSPTTTAASSPSGRTACSTSASATAAAATTSTAGAATPRTSARCSARSSASTRAGRGRGRTASPATTRSSGAPARGREVYAYGLRNPWRFSFDRETGDLVIGDVGQDAVEEIDFAAPAACPRRELRLAALRGQRPELPRRGRARPPPARAARRRHDEGFCSITGGYVVRDPALPRWRGRYVYGDYCQARVRAARLTADGAEGRPPSSTSTRSARSPRSARTPAAASTSSRSTGRSTGSRRGDARRRTTSRWSGRPTPGRSR